MLTVLALIFAALTPGAHALEAYYGQDLARWDGQPSDQLKRQIHTVLNSFHLSRADQPDEILSSCPEADVCYRHTPLTYNESRKQMFGTLFLVRQNQLYALPDLYCMTVLDERDFPRGKGPGPGKIPSTDVMNTEHAWPQSRFSSKFPKATQKADLHILFPVSSNSNSLRNNHPYGDVTRVSNQVCRPSALGYATGQDNQKAFMPPLDQRGEFARATFYFSTRYRAVIDSSQEAALRRWHHDDPVTEEERRRNQAIFELQHDRNPFVDHPEWVDGIADF